MEHTPPPFFKRGPAPLVRLFFFASLSLALLIVDSRFRYAEGLRSTLALVAYPLQRLATAPFEIAASVGSYFTTQDQAIRVQVVRNGLRAVASGGGPAGTLELRFMAANAEIQNGDRLVTSGIDGTYPPGLPVATVVRIERDAEHSFARIVCNPAAGVGRGRFVLVRSGDTARPARPEGTHAGK